MTDSINSASHADASRDGTARQKIAVIGIGCRLPGGASDHRVFWQNLIDGKDCLTPTPADRYDVATLGSRDKTKPGRLTGGRGGYIDGFDEFDPAFFGISPREADHMDPQQRKLLEVAWEALEDGGQKPGELAGCDVGVYVGAFTLDYKILQFADLSFETLAAHTATGTMMTMASNRVSYCFDFRGPSISLDTACSSSLVAVHLACESLSRGETSLALAGGTLLHMAPQYTIAETKGGFLSPDGVSRAFDASANGYVRAEGVGLVALKRLDDALRDGDPIHAVVVGSGVNQDGRTNGITVPNGDAQVALIEQVCSGAGVEPGSLQYVEAHGTSTPVGDPIEANALGRALSIGRRPGSKCYVGSVKTNIGHTESAAGIAGLIKTALSLKHRTIPPHINLEHINPAIDLASLPYEIPDRPTAWPEHEGPARAGVNAFGFGGTNAHVLLEEAPTAESRYPQAPEPEAGSEAAAGRTTAEVPGCAAAADRAALSGCTILPLTARDPAVLPELAEGIRRELAGENGPEVSLADLGHTLAHRRQHLESRLSVVYSTRAELDAAIAAYLRGEPHPRVLLDQRRERAQRRMAWVFTGMGPQWWGMGRELFRKEPVYREAVERVDEEIAGLAGWSLIGELTADEAESRMDQTWLAQPANFAVQVGLAALWRGYGVRPDAIVGHSTGEVAAFYEAGVYSLADAVKVVVHRSRLQQQLVGTGTMLAVSLPEAEALRRLEPYGDQVSVAAVNSPAGITLAGDEDALTRIAAELHSDQIFAKFLSVKVPYHSAKMELIKDDLLNSLDGLKANAAQVPLYLTGQEGTAHGTELDAAYWWKNVRDSVRFHAAIDRLADDGHSLFLEIGPHPVLAHSIRECLDHRSLEGRTLPSIRRQEDEAARLTTSLASLHNLGVDIDWSVLQPAGRPVSLPRYPWKRDRHWAEPRAVEQIRRGLLDHRLLGRRTAGAEPTWEAKLDVETLPYLNDHRIQGEAVFPAAGYLEMAIQAVRAMTGATDAALADIRLRKALFLPDGEAKTVRLSFSAEDASFTVATVPGETHERTVHASGVVRAGQRTGYGPPLDSDAIRARSTRRLTGPDCYAGLAALGYHYGPAFQAIEDVWLGPDEALARIRPTAALGDDAAGHHIHPVLLDACFQSLLTPQLLAADEGARDTGIRLPLSIGDVRIDPVGDRPLWAHARITHRDADGLTGDIVLYTDAGTPLGRISGFRAGDIEKASTAVGQTTVDGWLADLAWTDAPLDANAPTRDPATGWLVLADARGVGDAFAALVAERGGHCHLVRPGDGYRHGRTESVVRPGSAEDLRRLLAELGAETGRFDAAVHLWNLDLPRLDETDRDALGGHADLGTYSLIALAQELPAGLPGSRLHIVTRGTQAVRAGDPVEPLGAPSWGIGRVLRYQELADHPGKLIDLDPFLAPAAASAPGRTGTDSEARRAEAETLLRELTTDDEHEIALRGGHRRTSRLRRATGLSHPLPPRLRADGSYLVTGAFGALGRLLCRTLARRGARRLILVGRTALPERGTWSGLDPASPAGRHTRFVKELEALGVQPILAPLDITDEAALTAWLADYRRGGLPGVRGVFHLAGQVRDTLLPEMDRQVFDAVHDPKVVGAYLLHRHLRDEPLDHFVLFASVASLLTTAGQTNYAAGNAFLDALAHHRRTRGLPALSLDWGPWATGMIEELGLIDHYRNSRGMSSLSPEAGMAVLERVLGQDRAQLLVATVVDWPLFLAWYPSAPPLVSELAAAGDAPAAEQNSLLDVLRAVGEEEGRQLLTERFTALVATVLRVPADRVDPAAGLHLLGLDSLLAMELRARVHTELGIALPVVALLSSAPVAELVDRLYAGLTELLAEEAGASAVGGAVELFEDEGRYPLTQNQKALWFLKQLNPDGFAYNIGGAVEVRVALDPELMFEAVRMLIDRHPSLRANFLLEEGQAVQRISGPGRYDLALFDVQDAAWEEIHAMIIREYREPYDLERDPLVRFRLFKRGEDRWVIMKAVHHIISDAISTFTFIEELLSAYEELRRGRLAELPPLTASYLDFLNQQNAFLAGRDAPKMLDYWRGHLPAEVPVLDLPTDKPRPAVQTHNGASEFFVLDEELSARVHALAREHNVTVFMVLLSAYYVLLHRYSGQDDIIVGSPVTGRTQEEFAPVYGYFVNPLPLHADLAGDPSVADLLAQVRATVLGGLDNQEYPFVLLVEQLGLQHDPSRSAVFQAMFILLTHKVATEKYGYRLEYIELPEEEGQFDLTLSAYEDESEHRFHCVFKYNTDLFLPATVRRLASHYVNLLDALTRAPAARPVTRLPMLGAQERGRILTQWSGADRQTPPDEPVHRLFSRAAAGSPQAVAVSAPSESGVTERLTYGELDLRSDELAAGLRGRGVRDGAVVALCMDKSPELIVTLLAVLKAGGCYLPLDPDHPADRLAYMVRNARALLVVVRADGPGRPPAFSPGEAVVVTVDELCGPAAPGDAAAGVPDDAFDLDAPAYVIHTSGSTGRPKAVRITHRNLASAYGAWRQEYRLDDDVRTHLQLAGPSFDVFTGDLVRALCSGGTLVLIGRELLFNTDRLYETMMVEGADCAEFVPAVVRGLIHHCERGGLRLDFMKLLVVGSDTWKIEEYRRLRDLCGPYTRLINSYGLTEATVDSTYFEGPDDGLEPSRLVPIGRPFPNTALYILDRHGAPVPAGVPGELCVGGLGVALGYAGDPVQTEQRFVTLALGPEADSPPVRVYRTGDLARWDAEGGVHLLGRADSQVKLRGHRIEIGEIESQLALWPGLSQAVVTVRQEAGESVLCAYCVPAEGSVFDGRELRLHLAGYLPTFMIPSYFTALPALPLTPNGKVDVAALPAPRAPEDEEMFEPPVTLYEVRMAAHWSSLLGLEQVGLRNDFFAAGGGSIKLIELIHHLQAEFNISIPVSHLFKATTLHGMARTLEHIITGRIAGAQPYLRFNAEQPGRRPAGTLFCFPPAGGHGLVYRQFASELPEFLFVAFNYVPGDDKVSGYADLIESIQAEGPCTLLGYSLGGNVAFEVAKELEQRGRTVRNVVIMDSYRIAESFVLGEEHLESFEQELAEHLRRHTGSEIVARETREQAREYLGFCGRTPNLGMIEAPVNVISDNAKEAFYAAGESGSWHGSSATGTTVFRGFGTHAEMLDEKFVERNAGLTRAILTGGATA
ncbi:amino acid adenylation domain-containing protein [Streptomyces sp. NPDC088725]|uniref:non-ribosomal peptide synthetase/type I polyketide synthase n=1 Tax=Streptomyces sp. NPDC088725 TaxID=3365873 RepID=UPI003815D401